MTLILFGCMAKLGAQDFHLTQYDAQKLYLNPSLTGLFDGSFRIAADYRNQWSAIASKPFQTMGISFDKPVKHWGWGAQILDSRAGAGSFNTFTLLLSGSYDYAIGKKKVHHIAGGIQGGFIQESVNLSKLTFDNQYSPQNGGEFNTALPNNENYSNQGFFIPDLNAGVTYYYSDVQSRFNPFIGFSAAHLTQPKETFFTSTNTLPIRYIVNVGSKINLTEKFHLMVKYFEMHQTNDRERTASIFGNYYLKGSEAFLIFGPTMRLSGPLSASNQSALGPLERDAFAIELGLKKGSYTYRLSYDINTSSLNPYTSGRGGIELSVIYIAQKPHPVPIYNCPRL